MSGLLLSAAVLGFGLNANAQGEDVTTNTTNKDVNSKATITVQAGEDPTEPEGPNEPSGETGQKGPLSIDNVIVFAFNDMKLSGKTQNIPLKSTKEQNVQVTDSRGTGAGWNLQIKQSELVNTEDTTKTLKGAYIKFANADVLAGQNNVTPTAAPVGVDYSQDASNKGDFTSIMTAESGKGLGTWLDYYRNTPTNGIELVVPSGNYAGDYAGSVTWRLSDGPTSTAPQS